MEKSWNFVSLEKAGTLFVLNFNIMLIVTQTQIQIIGVHMFSAFAFV